MKRQFRKESLALFASMAFIFAFSSIAGAVPSYVYTYTDAGSYAPSFNGDNPITYILTLNTTGPNTYGAIFTVENDPVSDPSPDWTAGWFSWKFSPNSLATITDPSVLWEVGSGSTEVLWAGGNTQTFLQGNFAGIYYDTLGDPEYTPGGLLLTSYPGSTQMITFNLTVDTLFLPEEGIPFKAGFYDGLTANPGKFKFNQLSEDLSVPEPATLLLLGTGLAMLWLFGRRRSKAAR